MTFILVKTYEVVVKSHIVDEKFSLSAHGWTLGRELRERSIDSAEHLRGEHLGRTAWYSRACIAQYLVYSVIWIWCCVKRYGEAEELRYAGEA